jgi:hypothetical protein
VLCGSEMRGVNAIDRLRRNPRTRRPRLSQATPRCTATTSQMSKHLRLNGDSISSNLLGFVGVDSVGLQWDFWPASTIPTVSPSPARRIAAAANASFLHAGAPHAEFDLSAFTGKWEELHAQIWTHIQTSAEETRARIEELIASAKAAHSKDSRAAGRPRLLWSHSGRH